LSGLGWQLFLAGRLDEAEAALRESAPSALTLCRLGRVLFKKGERTEARQVLMDSARLDPMSAPVFHALGVYYEDAGQGEKAIKCYSKALSLDRTDKEAALFLAQLTLQKDQASSEELANLSIFLEPFGASDLAVQLFLACAYLGLQRWSESASCFQLALKGATTQGVLQRCWLGLGEAYLHLGLLSPAASAYERALEVELSQEALLGLAEARMALGAHSTAIGLYEQVDGDLRAFAELKICEALLAECKRKIRLGRIPSFCDLSKRLSSLSQSDAGLYLLVETIKLYLWTSQQFKVPSSFEVMLKRGAEPVSEDVWSAFEQAFASSEHANVLQSLALACFSLIALEDPQLVARAWSSLSFALLFVYSSKREALLLEMALECAKEAVEATDLLGESWLLYGLACQHSNDKAMAQHCFIRAVLCDQAKPCAWLFLAQFYQQLGEDELFVAALERVQMMQSFKTEDDDLDSDVGVSWFLQASLSPRDASLTEQQILLAADMADGSQPLIHWRAAQLLSRDTSLDPCDRLNMLGRSLKLSQAAFGQDSQHTKLQGDLDNEWNSQREAWLAPHSLEEVDAILRQLEKDPLTGDDWKASALIALEGVVLQGRNRFLKSRLLPPIDGLRDALDSFGSCSNPWAWQELCSLHQELISKASTVTEELGESEREALERIMLDWLRMRVTPETVKSLANNHLISQCILRLWKKSIPGLIHKLLQDSIERFA